MADFKFPKDNRFADYAALVDPEQVQPVEVPFDDEVSTDFSSLENRKKVEDMYDQDRASEIAIANQRMKDLMDEWKGVKRKKEVENYVGEELKDKVSRKPASEQPEGPTPEEVRKILAQDPKPELDDADSYDRAYEGRQIEEANKTVQAANAPKEEEEPLSERELLQRARIAAQGRDDEMTFLDDMLKAGAIGNQALASQGGYKVAQAKLPSMKTDMASRYDKLIKEYDALKKPSSKGKDIYKVGDELVQVKDGQVKKLYEGKGKKTDWKEKESFKLEEKDRIAQKKENREVRKNLEETLPELDKQEKNIKEAISAIKELKKNPIADTGPLDQYVAGLTSEGQKARKALNKLSLDKMVKMFAGMSKAVDSDNERKAFEQAQPSMGQYPDVNLEELKKMLSAVQSLRSKSKDRLKSISKTGEVKESVVSKEVSSGMVRVKSPNGKVKLIPREQLNAAIAAGGKEL